MNRELIFQMALSQIPKIGPILAKNLLSYCGSPEAIFAEKLHVLKKIPGIGDLLAREVVSFKNFDRFEKECAFIERRNVKSIFFNSPDYPYRLRANVDAPLMLYLHGEHNLDAQKMVGVVGTRLNTSYGRDLTENLVKGLAKTGCTVVSGLAYGIDYEAHKSSLKYNLPTIAVLAHGLDRLYPDTHTNIANQMINNQGALVTEFMSRTKPDRENFPKRNRIVAGLIDVLVVVQSPTKGGSMITANLAFQYDREVMAFPGKVGDSTSEGCHSLIKTNRAHLIESSKDLIELMNYDVQEKKVEKQATLMLDLTDDEIGIVNQLKIHGVLGIDSLSNITGLNSGKLSHLLLKLEINDLVRTLPGKHFELK
jgi:DNA processing protein